MATFTVGDTVQTPLGKGVVRELRSGGQLVVVIGQRNVLVAGRDARAIASPNRATKKAAPPVSHHTTVARDEPAGRAGVREVDLHGLVVDDAMTRAVLAINDALLEGASRLRVIHGRSGGRIKAALHRELREIPSVRAFRVDPANQGVTIVEF